MYIADLYQEIHLDTPIRRSMQKDKPSYKILT